MPGYVICVSGDTPELCEAGVHRELFEAQTVVDLLNARNQLMGWKTVYRASEDLNGVNIDPVILITLQPWQIQLLPDMGGDE